MIGPLRPSTCPVPPTQPSGPTPGGLQFQGAETPHRCEGAVSDQVAMEAQDQAAGSAVAEPIPCRHCGRTASNGISCEGSCVADSGY